MFVWCGGVAVTTQTNLQALSAPKINPLRVLYATGQPTTGPLPTAKEILDAQYDRGEITRAMYELKKLDINKSLALSSKKGGKNMMMGFGLIVGLIVLLLVVAITTDDIGCQSQNNQTGPVQASQTPVEILKAGYAGGEISREEYEQERRDLEG